MSVNDSLQKSLSKRSKRGVVTDSTELHNENDLISKSGALVTTNSSSDQSLENQLRTDNAHLQLQLEAGYKIIENLKKNIDSYEGIIQNFKSGDNKNISITENSEIIKFLRVLTTDNNELNSDKRSKRHSSRGNLETHYIHDKERLRNSSHIAEISQLKGIIKKYKDKIRVLKMKLSSEHATDSPTETNGSSLHSVYRPNIDIRKAVNGKRGRPHNRKGRPRKSMPTNESTSSGTETNPKKVAGRLKRFHPTKNLVTGEPVVKKARGRPRITLEKDLSLDNTVSKMNNDESVESSKNEEENIDNMGNNQERKRSPRKLPFNENVATGPNVKKGRGRPRKSGIVNKKHGRGRLRLTNEEKTVDGEKDTGDQNEFRRKSKGRPKKMKSTDNDRSSNS